jgi:hypothetical protein
MATSPVALIASEASYMRLVTSDDLKNVLIDCRLLGTRRDPVPAVRSTGRPEDALRVRRPYGPYSGAGIWLAS